MSQSDPHSGSSHYSSNSSNTFLAVPRNITSNDADPPIQPQDRHVTFHDPRSLQKSEHKESIEETELMPSKQSLEKRSLY